MGSGWSEDDLNNLLRSRPDLAKLNKGDRKMDNLQPQPSSSISLPPLKHGKIREGESFYRYNSPFTKNKESVEQSLIFNWIRLVIDEHPVLKNVISYPAGGFRPMTTGKTMKREGQAKGFPDIFSWTGNDTYSGLGLEMKVEYRQPRPEQVEWLNYLASECNWFTCICWHRESAIKVISWYFRLELPQQGRLFE